MHVQFGCGFSAPAGWRNFDGSPTLRFERLPLLGRLYTRNAHRFPAGVEYGNIVRGLPLPENSVDALYASHVLEHLSFEDCSAALRNSLRILRPGGVFRLIVPDLRGRAERYLRSDSPDAANWFMSNTYLGMPSRENGLARRIIESLGNSRHLWMWDERSMGAMLAECGFNAIRRCAFGDSIDPKFSEVEIEDRFVEDGITAVAIECRKPA